MFEDLIKPRVKSKKIKNPWDFSAPNYDQRSGPSVAAGDYYGVGFKSPVGKLRESTMGSSDPIPRKPNKAPAESGLSKYPGSLA